VKKIFLNIIKTIALLVVVYILFFVLSKLTTGSSFGTWNSFSIILQQSMLNALVGWAMSFNMLNKRWDFSVGSIIILGGIVGANLAQSLEWGPWGALFFCLIICMVLGFINGIVQIGIAAPTLVTSFGLLMVYETVETIVFGGRGAHVTVGSSMTMLGQTPWIFVIGSVFAAIHFVIYTFTKFGYNNRSLSNNLSVAKSIGISENKDIFLSYIFCGFFAGAAAVVYMSFRGAVEVSVNMGTANIVFEAMLPVFIGMFIARYSHITVGIYVGSLTVKILTAGLMAIGLSSTLQTVANGILLFVIIAYSSNQEKIRQHFLTKKTKQSLKDIEEV
jgi:ribose transport system permease protein